MKFSNDSETIISEFERHDRDLSNLEVVEENVGCEEILQKVYAVVAGEKMDISSELNSQEILFE